MPALQKQVDEFFGKGEKPPIYLIFHPQREERRRLMEKLSQKICEQTEATLSFHEMASWEDVFYELSSPSLFLEKKVFAWDIGKNLEESVVEKIARYIQKPALDYFLIVGAESHKAVGSLVKQNIITLDMAEEKPWDKEKRLQQELFLQAKNWGKTISPAAAAKLLAGSLGDSLFLENELAKLVCYVGQRRSIEESDVAQVGARSVASTTWQIAESLVWEGKFTSSEVDTSFLLGLLAQVRFLLQQARKVAWCIQERKGPEEIGKLVNLRASQLSKIIERVKKRRPEFFDQALALVYEEEVRAKNSGLCAGFLFSYFVLRITQMKKGT
jgi:DNA polymerase-3 subunit delta